MDGGFREESVGSGALAQYLMDGAALTIDDMLIGSVKGAVELSAIILSERLSLPHEVGSSLGDGSRTAWWEGVVQGNESPRNVVSCRPGSGGAPKTMLPPRWRPSYCFLPKVSVRRVNGLFSVPIRSTTLHTHPRQP
jgi:hypothetical protein